MNFNCDDWRVVVVNGIKYDDYRVDKDGRLYSVRTGLFIKGSLNNKGYVKVRVNNENKYYNFRLEERTAQDIFTTNTSKLFIS